MDTVKLKCVYIVHDTLSKFHYCPFLINIPFLKSTGPPARGSLCKPPALGGKFWNKQKHQHENEQIKQNAVYT